MTPAQTNEPTPRKPLRLWPGVVAVALQWLVRFVVPVFVPDAGGLAILGGLAGGLAVIVWWLFFSRAPWVERVGAIVVMVGALLATSRLVHESIANGMMGMMLPLFAIPVLSLALVSWAVASRRLSTGPRRAAMVVAILLACGVFTLLRTGGITGDAESDLHWRWTASPEERLLAQAGDEPLDAARGASLGSARGGPTATSSAPTAAVTPDKRLPGQASDEPLDSAPSGPLDSARGEPTARGPAPTAEATPEKRVAAAVGDKPPALAVAPTVTKMNAEWPGFRGPARDGIVHGVQIETNWSQKPPVELWRRPIGPGWSSFAVHGNLLYTQEQRGEDEVVSCYNLTSGEPVWRHRDPVRFWESNGGAGPRGTPTLSNGRVYTFGATGVLNSLDAGNGAVVWSRNVAADTEVEIPGWGFASSPLVVNDSVIVAASGRLAAYDVATGRPRWFGPTGGNGYSSPHLVTIDGVAQILLLRGARTISVAPADGAVLWEDPWEPGVSIVQPAQAPNGDILIVAGDAMGGVGMRRIAVARGPGGWTVEERWTSAGLKPYFNDFVVHEGHAFGFDGSIMACIDLENGTRKWKGGRYGHGQLVLLPDQDVLLVLSEEGQLALVKATPDQFTELARFPVFEGKSWNHPVLVGDVLLVRNGEEMAAFRLSRAGS